MSIFQPISNFYTTFKQVNFWANLSQFSVYKKDGRLVGFYGISTLVGYLMPNPVCTYIY